jgi:aldose 1-epimerase
MAEPLTLRNGSMALDVLPGQGACWQALRYAPAGRPAMDILRPMPDAATDPFASGGFALVPWSNRLFGGRLMAGDQSLSVPATREGIAHPVHGVGWQTGWQVERASGAEAVLSYRHSASDRWPFDHQSTQTLELRRRGARFGLTVANTSLRPMPVGAGFHPWLAADAGDTVAFDAATVWQQDAAGWPAKEQALTEAASFDFHTPRAVDGLQVNHCFGGWQGSATLERHAHGVRVRLTAAPQLAHLVVYRVAHAPWICIEPVSHATGAWSLPALHAADQGVQRLEPGAQFSVWMELHVEDMAPAPAHGPHGSELPV